MDTTHDELCGRYCDGKPPKCRGGDCTLCDEVDCTCDLIRQVRADTIRINAEFHYSRECEQVGYDRGRADERKAAAERVAEQWRVSLGPGTLPCDEADGESCTTCRIYRAAIAAALREGL